MTSTASIKTEAELQARLEARIRAALPLLPAQIKLERYLHLQLGHHAVVIDGFKSDRDEIRGRYDVLVLLDGKPLLIAELKAPEVAVGEDDLKQVLSYTRSHEPMVPLALVTNGTSILLRRTYDGAELQASDVSVDRLQSVLGAAAKLAASATEDAVRTLLGASQDTWAQVLGAWSHEAITALTGSVQDFKFPIARELSILRATVKQLEDRLVGGARVLILHGPPLSGVTNILAQLVRNKTSVPILFVDGNANPDVLQFIANRLSRELSFGISKDDVRSWLNTRRGLLDVTLVIDGLPRDGVDELIENAASGLLRLVIGMDSETHRRCSTVAGRVQQSLLGRYGDSLELLPLSDDEFLGAIKAFENSFEAYFFNGAQHIPELRLPRSLRVIASALPERMVPPADAEGYETCLMIPPIPGPKVLDACSRAFASEPMLKFDLQKLTGAFLADAAEHGEDPDWLAATWGRPSVDPRVLEQLLGEKRVARLQEYGFLSWIDTQALGPRLLVRVEELLAHHVAEEWSNSLASLADRDAIAAKIERLLQLTLAIPAGDLALSAAIWRASQKNATVLTVAICYLSQHKPTVSRLKEGAKVDLLLKGNPIRLHLGEGTDEEVIGDLQPWIVLSHLASWPMTVAGYELSANFSIFAELGASRHLLYQPRPTELVHMPSLHCHDIDGIGSVLCLATGIVEPLLQAMLNHAHTFPDELVYLAQLAMDTKEVHLAWRVLTVAIASITSNDEAVERASEGVTKVLGDWWRNALREALKETRPRR